MQTFFFGQDNTGKSSESFASYICKVLGLGKTLEALKIL